MNVIDILEDKRERFRRLATLRTNAVLQKLRVLGNCSNRATYAYTDEEVAKIFSELDSALKEAKLKFRAARKEEFTL